MNCRVTCHKFSPVQENQVQSNSLPLPTMISLQLCWQFQNFIYNQLFFIHFHIALNLQDRLIDKWKFPVFRVYCRARNVVCSQLKERCEDFCKQGPLVVSLLLQVEIIGSSAKVVFLCWLHRYICPQGRV